MRLWEMNALLCSLVVFATFVTFCHAQCYFIPIENIPECKDLSGVTHQVNSKWKTKNCEQCSCLENGIHCCNTVPVPVGYDESKCKKIFNKEACSYTVVEQNNPEKTCTVTEWIM
ncbi:beta-microseminoprotein [Orycteropus afer afer]|uniref:Beta-microseminoprotein n=1 Tax=Orycteropus afer afer TaxID=1230840 RepID=A0A8B6ZMJ0_ORYAF|nr:beta-microseminoprotein [Orycteropus afer afer]